MAVVNFTKPSYLLFFFNFFFLFGLYFINQTLALTYKQVPTSAALATSLINFNSNIHVYDIKKFLKKKNYKP